MKDLEIDLIVDKYIELDEGAKTTAVFKFLSKNMDRGLSIMDKSITALRLHRTSKNFTDKEKQLLSYQEQAHQLKETFVRIAYRIQVLQEIIKDERNEQEGM